MEVRVCPRGHLVAISDLSHCPRCASPLAGAEVREVPDPPEGTTPPFRRPARTPSRGVPMLVVGALMMLVGCSAVLIGESDGFTALAWLIVWGGTVATSVGAIAWGVKLGIEDARA